MQQQDQDFYQRKIVRLEHQLQSLQDEISMVRARLRASEDSQIKCQLLYRQGQAELARIRLLEKEEDEIKQTEYVQAKLKEQETIKLKQAEETKAREDKLLSEINTLKAHNSQLQNNILGMDAKIKATEIAAYKLKSVEAENVALIEQIDELKKTAADTKQKQMTALRDSLTNSYKERTKSLTEMYEYKIRSLSNDLDEKCAQLEELRITLDAQQTNNNFEQKVEKLSSERLARDSEIIGQIEESLRAKIANHQSLATKHDELVLQHAKQIEHLKAYNKVLEDKIYSLERTSSEEVANMASRLAELESEQIHILQEEICHLQGQIKEEKESIKSTIFERDAQLNDLKRDLDQTNAKLRNAENQLKSRSRGHQRKGNELKHDGADQSMGSSFKDFDSKEDTSSKYEDGMMFWERQCRKYQSRLQNKDLQVNHLLNQIEELRKTNQEELKAHHLETAQTHQQFTERIFELQNYVSDLQDTMVAKERDLRKKDGLVEKTKKEHELRQQRWNNGNSFLFGFIILICLRYLNFRRYASLNQQHEELSRDYHRLIENRKYIEQSYRQERDKTINSKSQIINTKTRNWLELQQQKNELEIIYKEKENQNRCIYEAEIARLRGELGQLKTEVSCRAQQLERMQGELEKITKMSKEDRDTQKYLDYQRKLASLNLEIALTENIHEALTQARFRLRRGPLEDITSLTSLAPAVLTAKNFDEPNRPLQQDRRHEQAPEGVTGNALNIQSLLGGPVSVVSQGEVGTVIIRND